MSIYIYELKSYAHRLEQEKMIYAYDAHAQTPALIYREKFLDDSDFLQYTCFRVY